MEAHFCETYEPLNTIEVPQYGTKEISMKYRWILIVCMPKWIVQHFSPIKVKTQMCISLDKPK